MNTGLDSVSYHYPRSVSRSLQDVTVTVEPGEILGVVGPNGSGKTTMLALLSGWLRPRSGVVLVLGSAPTDRKVRRRIGYAPEPPVVPSEIRGLEWLQYLASHRHTRTASRNEAVETAVEFGDLHSFVARRVAGYSRGMVQRLAIAAATMVGTEVVILDETLSGLDPVAKVAVRERLIVLAASGVSIVLASHDGGTIERLATRAVLLDEGRLVAEYDADAIAGMRVLHVAIRHNRGDAVSFLTMRFPGARPHADGVEVPLSTSLTADRILAVCHQERVPVVASKVRHRGLEEMIAAAARSRNNGRSSGAP